MSDINSIKGRKIALIGGAGFIGHNLALSLKLGGADVAVIDGLEVNNIIAHTAASATPGGDRVQQGLYLRMLSARLELLKEAGIPLHVQDARDYHGLSRVLSAIAPQVIVHLAAVSHAGKSNKDPHSTFDHSLRTLENALDNYKLPSLEHFVYFSSSMVYGHFPSGFVTEETPCEPLGIYGALKFAGEKMVIAYNQVFKLPYTIVRPSALYGPRCVSRRVGQIFIENAMREKRITIAGDGSDELDFTYIDDLVQGITKVIAHEGSRNQVLNLTYGKSSSIARMAELLREHFPKAEISYEKRDDLMPERGTLSVEKARRLIGYEPRYPLDSGFHEYIKWYKSFW